MINLSVFLNTRVENSGALAWIGDKGLAPVRYLFNGKTIHINIRGYFAKEVFVDVHRVASFHKLGKGNCSRSNDQLVSSSKNMIKTALSILFLVPGLFLALFKGFAYLSDDVIRNHNLVKESLTPERITIGSPSNPITTEKDLLINLRTKYIENTNTFNKPTDALIIYGNGKLTINEASKVLDFNPMKLILVGTKFVHKPSNSTSGRLDDNMVQAGTWQRSAIRILETPKFDSEENDTTTFVNQIRVQSIDEALQTPASRRGWFTCKRYHMVFNVAMSQIK